MRFYGLLNDEDFYKIIDCVKGNDWIVEDLQKNIKEKLNEKDVKLKLRDIAKEIKSWKSSFKMMPESTIFVFVSDKEEPKAFKIYDTTSLGCATSLTPPRWKIYKNGLEF